MKRQTVIWIVIAIAFAALIGVRASMGRMGRIYVTPVEKTFERYPATETLWTDSGGKMPIDVWVPKGTPHEAGLAPIGEPITITTWREVTATEVFKARAAAAAGAPAAVPPGGATAPATPAVFELSWPRTLGLWLAALFTIAVFSFLYRDNPLYKLAESVVVGASAAYYMIVGFWDVLVPKLFGTLFPPLVRAVVSPSLGEPTMDDRIFMALALILGVMLLMQLVPKVRWMAVWPLAFVIGTFAGLKLYTFIESDLLGQLRAATAGSPVVLVPEAVAPGTAVGTTPPTDVMASVWASLKNTLLLIGTICTLVYFFFSLEHKGATGRVARVGIWFLMITFGAAFGFTVMGRVTLLAKRFEFLFDDWLWWIDPAGAHQIVGVISSTIGALG